MFLFSSVFFFFFFIKNTAGVCESLAGVLLTFPILLECSYYKFIFFCAPKALITVNMASHIVNWLKVLNLSGSKCILNSLFHFISLFPYDVCKSMYYYYFGMLSAVCTEFTFWIINVLKYRYVNSQHTR